VQPSSPGATEPSDAGSESTEESSERLLRIQRDLAIELGSSADLDGSLRAVLAAACSTEGVDCGGVYLIDRRSHELRLAQQRGLSAAFVAATTHYSLDSKNGRIVMQGEPVYIHFTELQALVTNRPELPYFAEGLRAFCSLPVFHQGELIGSLNVASHTYESIPAGSRRALEAIVSQIGGALARIKIEARYKDLLESLQDGVCDVDLHGRIRGSNHALRRMLGYDEEELVRLTFWAITPPRWHELERATLREQLQRHGRAAPFEKELVRRDGTVFPVETTVYRALGPDGSTSGHWAIVRDLSERRQAEEQLRSTAAMLRIVFDNAQDGFLLAYAGTRRFHSGNRRMCELLGCSMEELSTLRVDDIHPPEDLPQILENFARQISGDQPLSTDVPVCRRDGAVFYADILASPVTIGGERLLLGSFRDVTAQRAREAEIQRAERLESVGLLAGGIAHDFNNILTGITGHASLARRRAGADPELQRLLGETERAAMRARELTQQLLTFARGGAPVRLVASLADLVQEAAVFSLRGSETALELQLPADLWPVEMDRSQIGQVVQNLVINASQAMAGGGLVSILAANLEHHPPPLDPLPPGRYVRLTVRDRGCGIPPEDQARIFDPYFTTKEGGSGLGLAVCYSIVRKHAGRISVESTPGRGTSFHVALPASALPLAPPAPASSPVQPPRRRRILVMDDDEGVRSVAEQILTLLGQEVACAREGREALRLLQEARAGQRPFELVILDLTVPGGMGGLECLEELRQLDPTVPVVVSSGYANAPVLAEHQRYGLAGILAKPYRIEEVRELLARV